MGTEEQFAIAWEKFLSFVREYIQKNHCTKSSK